jgi:hypothetical protein
LNSGMNRYAAIFITYDRDYLHFRRITFNLCIPTEYELQLPILAGIARSLLSDPL